MAAVSIDENLVYGLVVLAFIMMAVGMLIGYKFLKRSAGAPATEVLNARKKGLSMVFQLAPNNLWRFIPVISKFGNTWFTMEGAISVTKDFLHPLVGSAPIIIETTLTSDPNDTFSNYANQLAQQSGVPPSLNEIITFLDKRKTALTDLITAVDNIKTNNNLRGETEALMAKRNIPLMDDLAYQSIAERLSAAINTGGALEYIQELGRVNDALKITKDEKIFEFVKNPMGDVVDVVSKETITIDDFVALTPAGTVQDVQTVAQRNEAVAVKEGQFTINSAMKYVAIGVVIFIALVGLAYFVKSG